MIKNYIITSLRLAKKQSSYYFLNIGGLVTGMLACLLILSYVRYEKTYDKSYPDSDQIYRISYHRWNETGNRVDFASACPAIGNKLESDFDQTELVTRLYKAEGNINIDDKVYKEHHILYAESSFFSMFGFDILDGNSKKLDTPNTAMLSESMAKKYFGEKSAIGKSIRFNNQSEFEIIGIYKDLPENIHFEADILFSHITFMKRIGPRYENSWVNSGFFTYLKIKDEANPKQFQTDLDTLINREVNTVFAKYKLKMAFELQKVGSIHLNSNYMQEMKVNGSKRQVTFLLIIAWFIIIIAWFNFLNLSAVAMIKRMKEMGIRKVLGALKRQIIQQFLTESLIINLISIILVVVLMESLQVWFESITGIQSGQYFLTDLAFLKNLMLLFAVGIVCALVYPFIGLRKMGLTEMLKTKIQVRFRRFSSRKVLVAFQFCLSIMLISATFLIYKQNAFLKNRNLGFNFDKVIVLEGPTIQNRDNFNKIEIFKQKLKQNIYFKDVSYSSEIPGTQILFNSGGIYRIGGDSLAAKDYRIIQADTDYAKVMELKFLAGRNFDKEKPDDQAAVILNEKAVYWIGMNSPKEAINEIVHFRGRKLKIIGVTKNYHHLSPANDIDPILMVNFPHAQGYLAIKTKENFNKDLKSIIVNEYKNLFPDSSVSLFLLEDHYMKQYKLNDRFGTVFGIFSLLSIIITSLGIFSMASFTANQRQKEIGVRKVNGATVNSIISLLFKDYFSLIILAGVIASPVVYLSIDKWLQNFSQRTQMSWWIFIIATIIVGLISLCTVAAKSLKTANQNPSVSLKYE